MCLFAFLALVCAAMLFALPAAAQPIRVMVLDAHHFADAGRGFAAGTANDVRAPRRKAAPALLGGRAGDSEGNAAHGGAHDRVARSDRSELRRALPPANLAAVPHACAQLGYGLAHRRVCEDQRPQRPKRAARKR